MSCSILEPVDFRTSEYIITHVFYPLQLPDANDHSVHHDYSLASAIAEAACLFGSHVNEASVLHWHGVSRMLENLAANVQFESLDKFRTSSQFGSMDVGGKLSSARNVLVELTTRRCPHIAYPSPKCGGHLQKAEGRHHLRVV